MRVLQGITSTIIKGPVSVGPSTQIAEKPPRKKQKLQSASADVSAAEIVIKHEVLKRVTLWDLKLEYDISSLTKRPSTCEVESTDFCIFNNQIPKSSSRQQGKRIFLHSSGEAGDSKPFIVIAAPTESDTSDVSIFLTSLVALTATQGTFEKKMRKVYGQTTQITRMLRVQGGMLTIQAIATTEAFLVPTHKSIALANDANFQALLNLNYPNEVLPEHASVSSFYSSLHPPPGTDSKWESVSGLNTELMQYQRNAVDWMVHRECDAEEQPNLWMPYFREGEPMVYMVKSLGLITESENNVMQHLRKVSGGILADEMGLGKSLEVIATVLKNPRSPSTMEKKSDYLTCRGIKPIATTLIVAPHSILHQWLDEVSKHSNLRAIYYEGVNAAKYDDLAEYDIVVTSYTVLSADLWYAIPNTSGRTLRNPPAHEKRQSPLMEYEFWRVVMDEAQMIQSGHSKASQVACLIPRALAWVVTGTPISTSCADLYGILHFLRFYPVHENPGLWNRILQGDTSSYHVSEIFRPISCRNTKALVSSELKIAAQTRYLCQIDLSPIEEQYLRDTLAMAFNDLDLDHKGVPLDDDWSRVNMTRLHTWLSEVREACFHYRGGHSQRGLRSLRTDFVQSLDQVLADMQETTERELETSRRAYFDACISQGEVKEYLNMPEDAQKIWFDLLPVLRKAIIYNEEIVEAAQKKQEDLDNSNISFSAQTVAIESTLQSSLSQLRGWRQSLHKCLFLLGAVCHRLERTDDETEYYAQAKEVRSKMLSETETKAMARMAPLRRDVASQNFVTIPEMLFPKEIGAFLTRATMEKLQTMTQTLNDQANQLDIWRESCIERLTSALADQNDDPSGEEYQKSLDAQAEASAYHELVRFLVHDRNAMITGEQNNLIKSNIQQAIANMHEDTPEIILDGLKTRDKLLPVDDQSSLKQIRFELRAKMRAAESTALSGRDTSTGKMEFEVAKRAFHQLEQQYKPQKEAIEDLLKEVDRLGIVYNARLEYYRQFQAISDDVEEFTVLKRTKQGMIGQRLDDALDRALGRSKTIEEDEKDIPKLERTRRAEQRLTEVTNDILKARNAIEAGETRSRYLKLLGQGRSESPTICLICLESFQVGAFTVCGHVFCKDCFSAWFRSNRACPFCKKLLHSRNAYQTISMTSTVKYHSCKFESDSASSEEQSDLKRMYRVLPDDTRDTIQSIELKTSYSSKIDAIVRHLLYLPRGSKSILYSNFAKYLTPIQYALEENGIRSVTLDASGSRHASSVLASFKSDHTLEVLLMSGKSQSAGLTLIQATNLFIVDPILSPAIEQQITSRIHRIGQSQATSVFQYVVRRTIEENILVQSIAKRRTGLQNRSNDDVNLQTQPKKDHDIEIDDDDEDDQLLQVNEGVASRNSELASAEEAIQLFKGSLQRLERRDDLLI